MKSFPVGSGCPRLAILRDVEDKYAQDLLAAGQFAFAGSWRQEISAGGQQSRTGHVSSRGLCAICSNTQHHFIRLLRPAK
jgi:hypothetical protein